MNQKKVCVNQKIKLVLLNSFLDKRFDTSKELSDNDKFNLYYTLFIALLKKYRITESSSIRIQSTIDYFASIEEFEKCIDLVDILNKNKEKFK